MEAAFAKYEVEHACFLNHYESVKSHVNSLLAYFGKNKLLHEITQNELEKYVAWARTDTYQRKEGGKRYVIKSSTINRRLAAFQGMHTKAKKSWGVLVAEVDFTPLKLKENQQIHGTLKKSDVQTLWDAAPEHLRHFLIVSLSTGWRMSNVLSLKASQIDFEADTLRTIGKGGKIITSPLTSSLKAYLIEHGLDKGGYVCGVKGKRVESIKTAWNSLFKRTGMKRIRIHDLRHTYGTWLYEATGDQRLVQEALHHSDIKTSLRYTHTKQEQQRQKIEAAIGLVVENSPRISPDKRTKKKLRA